MVMCLLSWQSGYERGTGRFPRTMLQLPAAPRGREHGRLSSLRAPDLCQLSMPG